MHILALPNRQPGAELERLLQGLMDIGHVARTVADVFGKQPFEHVAHKLHGHGELDDSLVTTAASFGILSIILRILGLACRLAA